MGYFLLAVLIFALEFLPPLILGEPPSIPFLPFAQPYLMAATAALIWAILRLLRLSVRKNIQELYYLVLPLILLWSGNYFYLYRIFPVGSTLLSAAVGAALTSFVVGTVRALARKRDGKAAYGTKNFLLFVTMLSYFLALSVSYSLYVFLPRLWALAAASAAVFASTWVAVGFLYFLSDKTDLRSRITNLALSFIAAEFAWASSFWAVFYVPRFFPSNRENAAIPLAAVLISVFVLYIAWGVLSHRDAHELSKRVLYEYVAVGGAAAAILFMTTRWYLG